MTSGAAIVDATRASVVAAVRRLEARGDRATLFAIADELAVEYRVPANTYDLWHWLSSLVHDGELLMHPGRRDAGGHTWATA